MVLSAATFRLVQGYFTYQDQGHTSSRAGSADTLYRMLGESGVQSRLEAMVPSRLTPMVGRKKTPRLAATLGASERGLGRWSCSAVRRALANHAWCKC